MMCCDAELNKLHVVRETLGGQTTGLAAKVPNLCLENDKDARLCNVI